MRLWLRLFSVFQSALHTLPGWFGAVLSLMSSTPVAGTANVCVRARHAELVNRLVKPSLYASALLFAAVVQGATKQASAVDFYGYLDLGPRYSDSSESQRWTLDSRGSYVGVAGASDVSRVGRVFFQLEYEIYPDGGDAGSFQRNDVYLGVQTSVGVFRAGELETPLRHLADPVDLFPDTMGDASELWNGDLRTRNTIYYQAPDISLLPFVYQAELAVVLSGENDVQSVSAGKDGYSAALWFGDEAVGLAVAADRHIGDDSVSRQRIASYWSSAVLRLGVAVERESSLSSTSLAKLLSCALSLDKGYTVKAQYGKSDMQGLDEHLLSLGLDVLLEENFAVYTNLHEHRVGSGDDTFSLEAGLRFSF